MQVTTISKFRQNTKKYFDDIIDRQDILVIARSDGSSIVAMPIEHYNSMDETEYLLSNPVNAARLRSSVNDIKNGNVVQKTMDELLAYE
jgi:antitoxin YefM